MGLFRAAHGWGDQKDLLPKTCQTYPTMLKLSTVIAYLKNIQINISHITHHLSSADIGIYSLEISNFCYIDKYKCWLHFNT